MSFEYIENSLIFNVDMVATTVLAILLLLFGYFVKSKVAFFEKFCFPAPVIGGFVFSIIMFILYQTNIMEIRLDNTLQAPLMLTFFTTVGIGGSFALIKKGGKALVAYLIFLCIISIFQNTFGAMLAQSFGLDPRLGLMAGATSLTGGHGTASAIAPGVENMGVQGATAVALASATYGLIIAGLLGGPLANWLIKKHKLEIKTDDIGTNPQDTSKEDENQEITSHGFLKMSALLGVIMVGGTIVVSLIDTLHIENFVLPAYVGAMFVAIIFRNINDYTHMIKVNNKINTLISDITLGIFLTMAMMTLKIWELIDLALPLITILALQSIAMFIFIVFIFFKILGKSYDSAVLCAGMVGSTLGATPNAMANMRAVCEKYGVTSIKAFIVVPLCGSVLFDSFSIPVIAIFIRLFS